MIIDEVLNDGSKDSFIHSGQIIAIELDLCSIRVIVCMRKKNNNKNKNKQKIIFTASTNNNYA